MDGTGDGQDTRRREGWEVKSSNGQCRPASSLAGDGHCDVGTKTATGRDDRHCTQRAGHGWGRHVGLHGVGGAKSCTRPTAEGCGGGGGGVGRVGWVGGGAPCTCRWVATRTATKSITANISRGRSNGAAISAGKTGLLTTHVQGHPPHGGEPAPIVGGIRRGRDTRLWRGGVDLQHDGQGDTFRGGVPGGVSFAPAAGMEKVHQVREYV